MPKLKVIATTITGDEKAYSLAELNEQSPGSRGFHRYQIIQVTRDGRLAEFRKDMGSTRRWKGIKQFRIPSLFEHTVDELLDIAAYLRLETDIDLKAWLELDKLKLA
jgi:hypothetical protein